MLKLFPVGTIKWEIYLLVPLLTIASPEILFREVNEQLRKELENDRPCNLFLTFKDRYLSTPDIISKYGYHSERHWTTTEDGYILELHRIPSPGKPAVFLLHGIFGTSRDWMINCERRALPFKLHEQGYDVWLGNYRGNIYCQNHTEFKTTDPEFWNFAIDEVAFYDGPAMIDYVLGVTGKRQVSVVAHSMGNGVGILMMLARPEYGAKVKVWFALAAAAHLQDTKSPPFRLLAPFYRQLEWGLKLFNNGEFFPPVLTRLLWKHMPTACFYENLTNNPHGLCSVLSFFVDGYNPAQIPPGTLNIFTAGFPSTTSVKFVAQWFQWIISGSLTKFDRGPLKNLRHHGNVQPERYDIRDFNTAVYLFWAENDWIVTKESVIKTAKLFEASPKLKQNVRYVRVNSSSFTHLDYILGKDADLLIFDPVIRIMKDRDQLLEDDQLGVEGTAAAGNLL